MCTDLHQPPDLPMAHMRSTVRQINISSNPLPFFFDCLLQLGSTGTKKKRINSKYTSPSTSIAADNIMNIDLDGRVAIRDSLDGYNLPQPLDPDAHSSHTTRSRRRIRLLQDDHDNDGSQSAHHSQNSISYKTSTTPSFILVSLSTTNVQMNAASPPAAANQSLITTTPSPMPSQASMLPEGPLLPNPGTQQTTQPTSNVVLATSHAHDLLPTPAPPISKLPVTL